MNWQFEDTPTHIILLRSRMPFRLQKFFWRNTHIHHCPGALLKNTTNYVKLVVGRVENNFNRFLFQTQIQNQLRVSACIVKKSVASFLIDVCNCKCPQIKKSMFLPNL